MVFDRVLGSGKPAARHGWPTEWLSIKRLATERDRSPEAVLELSRRDLTRDNDRRWGGQAWLHCQWSQRLLSTGSFIVLMANTLLSPAAATMSSSVDTLDRRNSTGPLRSVRHAIRTPRFRCCGGLQFQLRHIAVRCRADRQRSAQFPERRSPSSRAIQAHLVSSLLTASGRLPTLSGVSSSAATGFRRPASSMPKPRRLSNLWRPAVRPLTNRAWTSAIRETANTCRFSKTATWHVSS
jgi:hypothetical protein